MSVDARPQLALKVRISYRDFVLDVDEVLNLNGITGLFGPSGGGKSTLLRAIAGLERSATGTISFGGECWQNTAQRQFVPPHRRAVGYVFQDARLFEHLSVAGNLEYASHRCPEAGGSVSFEDAVSTFDLHSLLTRTTTALSGGERQRVAIARTLLTQPRLLLLDEPLAALDLGRKGEILPYLEMLSERFGIPVIYVSHAIDEIARLANQVIVLDAGKIRAIGGATEVLNQVELQSPLSQFEAVSIMDATVVEHLRELELTRLDLNGQAIVVPARPRLNPGDTMRLHIRAGDVAIATQNPEGLSFRNVLQGNIAAIDAVPDNAFATITIDIAGATLRSELTRHAIQDLGLVVGRPVFALLKTASFDRRL